MHENGRENDTTDPNTVSSIGTIVFHKLANHIDALQGSRKSMYGKDRTKQQHHKGFHVSMFFIVIFFTSSQHKDIQKVFRACQTDGHTAIMAVVTAAARCRG
eukprot:scaffold113582_cov24-Attheya_sp.AAC.1